MKAVILGTDFIKDTDGSFKVLETNTNIAIIAKYIDNYFDIEKFNDFIVSNGINDIKIINQSVSMSDVLDLEDENNGGSGEIFGRIINYYKDTNVSVSREDLSPNSITVPYIEDLPNRLILRSAYDSTALIDDLYARDNFQFLKLMYDSNPDSIPKTYFVDEVFGIDGINESIRDNGIHPNFIVKERYPTKDYSEYPKIYKISSLEELQNLKASLPVDTLLQEYIIDSSNLLNGKIKTYRSVDMVYGPNLEIYNLVHPFVHTNPLGTFKSIIFMKKYALYIGRWQNWHKGHEWLIRQQLDKGKNIWVAIRDVQVDENNPKNAQEVLHMLTNEQFFIENSDKIIISIIPDIESVNYGRGVGYDVIYHEPPQEIGEISGTKIRKGEIDATGKKTHS